MKREITNIVNGQQFPIHPLIYFSAALQVRYYTHFTDEGAKSENKYKTCLANEVEQWHFGPRSI